MDFLEKEFKSIYNKMLAVAMDYKFYIDPRIKEDSIYRIRDSVTYRLNCTRFHFEILIGIIENLDIELTNAYREMEGKNTIGLGIHFDKRALQINYLTDSIFFHLGSSFDYIGNLVEYICISNKKSAFRWGQVAKSARDINNPFSVIPIAKTIDRIDRDFVSKLYDHRSHIIHKAVDSGPRNFSINIMEAECSSHIYSSNAFNKRFSELRSASKEYRLTTQYSILWVIKKSIAYIIEIQFALKTFMEHNKKQVKPAMFIKGQNGELLSPSVAFWGNNKNE